MDCWKNGLLVAGVIAMASGAPATAAEPTAWLHVRVEDGGESGERVSVNLPLSVVKAALKLAPERIVSEGRVRLGHGDHHMSVADLKQLWLELREAGEAELVRVEGERDTVRVAREGDRVKVLVDERDGDHVEVDVPIGLVDALLSAEGEELDIAAALDHLSEMRGEVVRVEADDGSVRIWIDEGAEG